MQVRYRHILDTVNDFREELGGVNNGNTPGSFSSGRREINWDGGGASALATVFPVPMTTFNTAPVTRGAVFTTAGTGFEISGAPNPEFGDINPTYPSIFTTFSSPRLFTPLGSNVLDVNFFVPGTNTPATTSGFGAVFTDVDPAPPEASFPSFTSIGYFDINNTLLGTFFAPPANNGLSFLGVFFDTGERIARARITSGNSALGAAVNDQNGNPIDVVVMDDFIYGDPRWFPNRRHFSS